MTPKQALAREANRLIRELFVARGYAHPKSGNTHWMRPLSDEPDGPAAIADCLARSTRISPHVVISPGYGLWFPSVNRFFAEQIDQALGQPTYTISDRYMHELRALPAFGYSAPRSLVWQLSSLDDLHEQVPPLVEVLTTAGLRWAEAHASLSAVLSELREDPNRPSYAYWLPAALCLSGEVTEARARIAATLAQYPGKGGLYLEQLRAFDHAIAAWADLPE